MINLPLLKLKSLLSSAFPLFDGPEHCQSVLKQKGLDLPPSSADSSEPSESCRDSLALLSYRTIIYKMSDIDLNQPIFQNEYACSERDSLPVQRTSQYFDEGSQPEQLRYSSNQINLFKPMVNYRMSETTTSKGSSPNKLTHALMKSQQNPLTGEGEREERKGNNSSLGSISQFDTFECHHKLHMNSRCEICQDRGFVKGDHNMVKFFQFIIGFKFGANQSYPGVRRLLKRKKTQVNTFCGEFYSKEEQTIRGTVNNCGFHISSKSNRSSHGVPSTKNHTLNATNIGGAVNTSLSNSLNLTSVKVNRDSVANMGRMSYKSTKKCCKDELVNEINNTLVVHEDYVCDQCQVQPIVGPRYHCNICEDYDSCGECYDKGSHDHMMEKIEKNAKSEHLKNVVNLLVQPIMANGRASLRPPPTIDNVSERVTTKSAIR